VLKAWSQAFPGVVQPKSAISQDLLDHLRYPQDFFKVQRQILARYHMTNPDNWYQRSSLWDVPNDPVAGASAQTKEPPFSLAPIRSRPSGRHFAAVTITLPQPGRIL
jgi:uncharacterized membrane protein (UPF0182 family)